MAKVELNIVALGDFSSVNAQIKSLQEQVALLQKNMAGVGVSSNFAKELANVNASFKQTMLSTGQFTSSTVKMTSETEKFGQALVTGKLKLTEYFNIIKQKNSEAVTQMKALAVEQTKLQNSIVMNDPSKQGILSVYTPTQIDKVANATKIAANEANLYALAVKKGSQELINWGKNTQWAGRQLTVGMSVPLMIFGQEAVKSFKDVNTELTRLQRLYGEGLTPPSQTELNQISSQVLDLGKQIAGTMGIAQTETVKAAANFAAMGRQGKDLLDTTAQTMRLSKLGAVSTADATNTVVALQNVYKVSTYQLADAVNFLSDIQKQTTMTLGDMTQAIPRVGPIMQQLGGTYKDTAVMLVAMREAGIPAAQAANAVKSAVASMIAPTAAASKEFQKYGINLTAIKDTTQGNPVKMIEALQTGLAKLSPLVKEQLIEKLFGKFQFARVSALLENFGKIGSQTQNALKIAGASSAELATLANQEMKQATESPTARYQRALESFKATLYPVGQELIKIATKLMDFGNAIGKVFSGLPGPLKSVMGAIAIGIALSGPIIMLTGLFANFAGYVLKGFFNLKQLATGGKTLGQLLTPELIAAQNANQLFATGIAGDVEAVNLLSKAIQDLTLNIQTMVGTLSKGTGFGAVLTDVANNAKVYEQMKLPGFATGGIVPGSGSGKVDTYPAMLAPGELVVDAATTKKYWPLFNAAINGKIPGYAKSNIDQFEDVYYSPTTGDKQYSAPKILQGGASALTGEDYPKIISTTEKVIEEFGLLDESLLKVSKNRTLQQARQQAYNQFTQQDLGHLVHEEKDPSKGKPWWVRKLANITHPENQTIEQLAPKQLLNKYVKETVDNMLSGVVKTGLSKEQIEKAAESIQLGKQPIDAAGMEVYTRILQTIRQKVKSGQLKIDASPGAVSNALVSEATMTSRVFPEEAKARGYEPISTPKLLSSITPKFLNDFRKQKKILLDELKQASLDASVEGENFATGYFAGIERRMTEAKAVAGGVVNAAINSVKRTQKSASPSKVAEQLGLDFGEGYVLGVSKADSQANIAGERLALSAATGAEEGNVTAQSGGLLSNITSKIPFMGKLMPGGKMSNMLKFGASSAIMMGGQTVAGMLPKGSDISGIASGAASGASIGMWAGPEAAAAGAAVGAALAGIKDLIKAEKEQADQAKSTFQSSADITNFFGGTVKDTANHLDQITTSFDGLATASSSANAPLSVTNAQLDSFNKMVKNLPANNPLSLVLDKVKSAGGDAAKIAAAFVNMQVAIGNIDPSKAKQMLDLILASSGKADLIGTVGTAKDQSSAVAASLKAAGKSGGGSGLLPHIFKDTLYGVGGFVASGFNPLGAIAGVGAAEEARRNGKLQNESAAQAQVISSTLQGAINSKSLDQIKAVVDGIGKAGISSARAIDIFKGTLANAAQQRQVEVLKSLGLNLGQIAKILSYLEAGQSIDLTKGLAGIDWNKIDTFLKNWKDPALTTPQITAAQAVGTSLQTQSDALAKQIKALEAKKKVIDAELKSQRDITAEMQRQHDYTVSQIDLQNKQKDALIHGDYLTAATLGQEQNYKTMQFNQQTKAVGLQGQSDLLAQKIADLNDKQTALKDAISNNSQKVQDLTTQLQKNPPTPPPAGDIKLPMIGPTGANTTTSLTKAYANMKKKGQTHNIFNDLNLDPTGWSDTTSWDSARQGIKRYASMMGYKPSTDKQATLFEIDHDKIQYMFKVLKDGNVQMEGQGKVGQVWDPKTGKFVSAKPSVNIPTPSVKPSVSSPLAAGTSISAASGSVVQNWTVTFSGNVGDPAQQDAFIKRMKAELALGQAKVNTTNKVGVKP